ncbi:methionyl-tRNA formyltransferase [Candidatus Falkowbacteria bacterium]|nr:methionyl-tRNA formyltransferase [Candidatus Falkowbacteria bacterium]
MAINLKEEKIIFMGTPDFGAPCLKMLIENANVIAVVTQPDKKVGRNQVLTPPPTKQIALQNSIPVLQPEQVRGNPEFLKQIKELNPDLIVVVAYGFILPKELLVIPKFGVINAHASLLPKYRGASPIQSAILNGDEQTGVTIMILDEQMDHGPILSQNKVKILPYDDFATLHDKLADLGAKLLIEILPKYLGGQLQGKKQKDTDATYCKLITKLDGKIDWHKPANEIERQVRAFNPWPGAFTNWEGKNLKILKSEVHWVDEVNKVTGEIYEVNGILKVQCGQEQLELVELQLEGKNKMSVKEFINGHPKIIGTILA